MKLLRKKIALSWKFRFAHHPLCSVYTDSVWKIGSVYLCQGCTIILSALVLSLLFFIITSFYLDTLGWITFGLLLALIPITVELSRTRTRNIKRLSRLITGVGLSALVWALINIPDLLVKIVGIIIATTAYQGFKWGRKKGKARDRCINCPDLIQGKICPGLEYEAKAIREYSDYATAIFSDRLRRKVLTQYTSNKDD